MKIAVFLLSADIDKADVPQALNLALMGIVVVFIVLGLLMLCIKLLSFLSRDKKAPASPESGAAPVDPPLSRSKVPAQGSFGECELNSVDEKTAALIMSIVADDLKAPLNELRFISIREV